MMNVWLRWLVVVGSSCLCLLGCLRIELDDSVLHMLPGGRGREDIGLLQRMGLVDRVVISLGIVDRSEDDGQFHKLFESTRRLGEKLEASGRFESVIYHLTPEVQGELYNRLRTGFPALFNEKDRETLEHRLQPSAIEQRLREIFLLLNSPAGLGLKQQILEDPLGIGLLALKKLERLRADVDLRLRDGYFVSTDGRHCLIVAQATASLTDSTEAARIAAVVEGALDECCVDGIRGEMVGTLPHTLANSRTIKHDLARLLPLASLGLLLLIGCGLKSWRGLVVYGIPFLAAPPAILVTSWLLPPLSGMAMGFGIVLLGIGVDFGIHMYLGWRRPGEVAPVGVFPPDRGQGIMLPVVYATLTTCGVFLVLLFSDVEVHRQMATLALVGLSLAVVLARFLMPDIVPAAESVAGTIMASTKRNGTSHCPGRRVRGGKGSPVWSLTAWLALLGLAMVCWPSLRYTADLRSMEVKDPVLAQTEANFAKVWGNDQHQQFLIARGDNLEQALERNSRLQTWLEDHGVHGAQSVADILPGREAAETHRSRFQEFWRRNGAEAIALFSQKAAELGMRPEPFRAALGKYGQLAEKNYFPENWLGTYGLGSILRSFVKQREAEYLVLTMLPPGHTLNGDRLEAENPGVRLIDPAGWREDVESRLRGELVAIGLSATALVLGLVWLQFRRLQESIAVLAPVSSALAAIVVFSVISGLGLNMMNMIMAVMVIGLSVDYGIFTVHAHLSGTDRKVHRAVGLCAASSLLGFGVLGLASHPALSALGWTVLVGVGVAWPTARWVSPVLLRKGNG